MAGQFVPLQLEIQSGVIQAVLPYGEKKQMRTTVHTGLSRAL